MKKSSIKHFLLFTQIGKISPYRLFLPVAFGLLAALCEGVSIGLLIPTIKGIIEMNFTFIYEIRILGSLLKQLAGNLEQNDAFIFIFMIGIIVLTALLKCILSYFSVTMIDQTTNSFSSNLRKAIYARYLSFGKLFFDRKSVGGLYDILMGFTNRLAHEIKASSSFLTSFFLLCVYVGMMIAISWKLTLVALMVLPILHYSQQNLIGGLKRMSVEKADASLSLSHKISNAIACIPLVKAYCHEEKEKGWFNFSSDRLRDVDINMTKRQALIAPTQEIVILFVMLILVSVMSYLYVRERSGDLSGYFVYFIILRRAGNSFGSFNQFRATVAGLSGTVERIMEVFSDENKFFIPDGQKKFSGLNREIRFKNLNYDYPDREKILRNIDLTIEKGKMTALVGPSGAGKTTLIHLLLRFYDSPQGTIFADGQDIRDFLISTWRSHVALVSQDTYLFNAPLRLNLTYGLGYKILDKELIEVMKKARLYELLQKLPDGLETEIGDRGIRLSGGEKQRVSIARAMLKNAELLILDEATSSLDTATERLIQQSIEELIKGRTSIVIAHRLSTIKNADQIAVLENGQIVEKGTLNELLDRKDKFFSYWEAQKFF